MPRDPERFLFDMVNSCEFLRGFTAGRTLRDLMQDRGFRSAVERELQIVGEALAQLNRIAPQLARRIGEYERIIGFRNVLVHGYNALDHEVVWFVVEHKLPHLQVQAQKLLDEITRAP